APAMIAVGIATLVTGDRTIYRSQLPTRADSPAHRYQFSFPLLSSLTVREAMQPLRLTFAPSTTLADAERHLAETSLPGAPVVDPRGRLVGVCTLADIQRVPPPERTGTPVEAVMTRDPVTTTPEAGLDVALESLATQRVSWMPVVEGLERAARGTVSAGDIVAAYRGALGRSVRRLRGLTPGTVLLESRVEPRSPLAGRAVRDLRLPGEALIVAIQRDGLTIVPRGSTELAPGDVLTVLVSPAAERAVRAYLTGELPVDGAARPSA
ncbi:MAG: CBS domain-containing protein, partial [Thermomicrobiaceae bacterium]|nr:CBS domain-containing protein [Thermomicrobiaceae bacterium]